MTLFQVSFANESDVDSTVGVPSLEGCTKAGRARFNLKKRTNDNGNSALSSYNSAFLSGLFADVAAISQSQDEDEFPVAATTTTEEDSRLDLGITVKRSRVSMTKSLSRCARSCKNLTEASSPVGVDAFDMEATTTTTPDYYNPKNMEPSCSLSMERMNSLHFQLNCVEPSPKSVKSVIDIIDMAFPHLPATVSDSSCARASAASPKPVLLQQQDLTHASDQQASGSETLSSLADDSSSTTKESYGWFVELDDGEDHQEGAASANPYLSTSGSATSLAFTASTAPKHVSSVEAEVEWAKAADTVDDVLGDFF